MHETVSVQYNPFEINPDARARRFREIMGVYEFNDRMFSSNPDKALDEAEGLFQDGFFTPASLGSKENTLHILMVADSLAVTSSPQDERWLLEVAAHAVDFSSQIRPSRLGYKGYSGKFDELLTDHLDNNRTREVASLCEKRGVGTPLHVVRKNLHIILPEEEKPFKVSVVDLTADEMYAQFGGEGFATFDKEGFPHVVVPRDVPTKTIEHEVTHALTPGVRQGGREKLLFSALEEAITEESVRHPSVYPQARSVMGKISSDIPLIMRFLRQSYKTGNKRAWFVAEKMLVHRYGLRGLLYVAACAPEDDPEHLGKAYSNGKDFFVNYKEVLDVLNSSRVRINPLNHLATAIFQN